MTRYEVGFMSKCAEYGLDAGTSVALMEKMAVRVRLNIGGGSRRVAAKPVARPFSSLANDFFGGSPKARAAAREQLSARGLTPYIMYSGAFGAGPHEVVPVPKKPVPPRPQKVALPAFKPGMSKAKKISLLASRLDPSKGKAYNEYIVSKLRDMGVEFSVTSRKIGIPVPKRPVGPKNPNPLFS